MSTTPARSNSQGRVIIRLCSFMISIRWPRWPKLLATRSRREDKLQVPNSHRATLHDSQSGFTEDANDFCKADVTMPVKMRNDTSFSRTCSEIDGQHSASGSQHSSYLAGAQVAKLARQMMQHHRT